MTALLILIIESCVYVTEHCLKILISMISPWLLRLLCFEDSLKSVVLGQLNLDYWWKLLEYQYQHNSVGTRSSVAVSWRWGVRVKEQCFKLHNYEFRIRFSKFSLAAWFSLSANVHMTCCTYKIICTNDDLLKHSFVCSQSLDIFSINYDLCRIGSSARLQRALW